MSTPYTQNEKSTGLDALTSLAAGDLIIVGDVSDNGYAKTITQANLITDLETNLDLANIGGTLDWSQVDQSSVSVDLNTQVIGELPLANGGTGQNLTDPGIDAVMGWDNTDNEIQFWIIGSGLSYNHSTHTISGSSGNGAGLFGDGSDGDATISGNTSLTKDTYYDNLTINAGITLDTAGFQLFVKGILTNNGTIDNSGGNGGNGGTGASGAATNAPSTGGTAGSAGTASNSAGTLPAGLAGLAGKAGGAGAGSPGSVANGSAGTNGTAGSAGTSHTHTISTSTVPNAIAGAAAGNGGGDGGSHSGGNGGTAGSAGASGTNTPATRKPHSSVYAQEQRDFDGTNFNTPSSIASNGGAGGGGSGGENDPSFISGSGGGGGGGGGNGANGGILVISANTIINSATGSILVRGGNGGNGGNGGVGGNAAGTDNGGGGGGAGGDGGNGGEGGNLILIYGSLTNSGTISAAGGSAGTAGTGSAGGTGTGTGQTGNTGSNGTNGVAGNTGTIYQIEV